MILLWLSKLLASILVSVLCSAIITTVLNQTIFSSHYLEGQLTAIHGYTRLSQAFSQEIVKNAGVSDTPMVSAAAAQIASPEVIKAKLNSALDQFQNYFKGNGQPPVIDLSDLAAQAQTVGLPLGTNTDLSKPIALGGNSQTMQAGHTFQGIQWLTVLTSIVLVVLLALLSWKRRIYTALPNVLISVGIFIGLLALVLSLSPGLIDHYLHFNLTSNAAARVGHDLAVAIAKDLGKRFSIIAVISLVIGSIARIVISRLKPKSPGFAAASPLPSRPVPRPTSVR